MNNRIARLLPHLLSTEPTLARTPTTPHITMLGESSTELISPHASFNADLYDLEWSVKDTQNDLIVPVPRHAPSVPTDVSDDDDNDDDEDEDSCDDDSPTSVTHPRSSVCYMDANQASKAAQKECDATSSPLTELIRAFEILKQSPLLGDTMVEDANVGDCCYNATGPISRSPQATCNSGYLAKRRHSEYALQFGVIVVPSIALQQDAMIARSTSWEKRIMSGDAARPRAMTGPLVPDDNAMQDNMAAPAAQPRPLLPSLPSASTLRRPNGFRARRPARLRIETGAKAQVPKLPQRRRKTANTGSAPPRSVSNPALSSVQQRDIRSMRAVTKQEWDALHAGVEIGMAPHSCIQTSLMPSSCVFPPSLMSRGDDEADRQPPTTAELHAAIVPFPLDAPSMLTDDCRGIDYDGQHGSGRKQAIHCREAADHSVQAWTLTTYNALRQPDEDAVRRPTPLRTTSLQAQTSAQVLFAAQPKTEDVKKVETVEGGSDGDGDDEAGRPCVDFDDLANSPSYADAFIFDQSVRPTMPPQTAIDGVSLHRVGSNAIASDSSASEFGEILTAPPAGGRGWHRGRRNAMCVSNPAAAQAYRRATPSSRLANGVCDDANHKEEDRKKRRHMSASAALSTVRSTIASWSHTSGTHKRKPAHPWKSPYPGSVGVMASTAAHDEESGVVIDAALLSLHRRRSSTARGQRGDCSSRIASMPQDVLDKGAQWEGGLSPAEPPLRGIASILSPTKRASGAAVRSSSLSFARPPAKDECDQRRMPSGPPLLPRRKRITGMSNTTDRLPSYGLGLRRVPTYDNHINAVSFPSSAPACERPNVLGRAERHT